MPLVSLVIPTLNEAKTIGECIEKANEVFKKMGLEGEIIVVDSSSDNTPVIARSRLEYGAFCDLFRAHKRRMYVQRSSTVYASRIF